MSWTDALPFSTATEMVNGVGIGWNAELNAAGASEPDDTDYAYTSSIATGSESDWLAFYNPLCASQVPGDINSTVIDTIEIQIRGKSSPGGIVLLAAYEFYQGSLFTSTLAFDDAAPQTRTISKTVAGWGLTQAQAWDFLLNGASTESFRWFASSPYGTTSVNCYWALCRVEYTYTPTPGSGILLGKL